MERVQRIGAQAVIGAFKIVLLAITESEAGLEGTLTQLHRRNTATWVQLQTKSSNHYFWKLIKALGNLKGKAHMSPLQRIAAICQQATLEKVECMEPFVMAPWKLLPKVSIPEREIAEEEAREITTPAIYTDASARNNLVGVGICWFGMDHARPPNIPSEQVYHTLAKAGDIDIYTAELHAIWHMLRHIHYLVIIRRHILNIAIFSDSKRAMQSL